MFRMGLVMTAIIFNNIYAIKDGEKEVSKKKPGLIITMLDVSPYAYVGTIIADRVCDEDEDYKKASIESLFVALSKSEHQRKEFSQNLLLNLGVRKGIRYANGKGITLDALGGKCDVIPKDWVTTRKVVNSTTRAIAEEVTKPQFITEIVKFAVASYVAKK